MSAALRLPKPEPRHAVRARLEAAIEQAIAALDAFDGDADYEPALGASESHSIKQAHWGRGIDAEEREVTCEDEGAQCEDEGAESDREPENHHGVPTYADDGDGGHNHLKIVTPYGPGVAISAAGC